MKSSWMYIGFSHHSVPSLSNTATRASGSTKSGPCVVTRSTKSTIADFVGPSFHMSTVSILRQELVQLLDCLVDAEARRWVPRRELLEGLEELVAIAVM